MAIVNVIYHHFPHYRRPVMREMIAHSTHEYRFFGSHEDVGGIKVFAGDDEVVVNKIDFFTIGPLWFLSRYLRAVIDKNAECLIVIGNPNMAASWLIAALGRLLRKKVVFWSHGWLKDEPILKRSIRKLYFSMPHRVLVYGERAKVLACSAGFDPDRVSVVYNSLNFSHAQSLLSKIEAGNGSVTRPQELFSDVSRPLLICTARLTALCRFDLLIDAAEILRDVHGIKVNILLVGDGPEREKLEAYSISKGVSLVMYGACYDEDILAGLIYFSDVTVSPGKVGLTAIHSLSYGTPVITHGNLDDQMPEVEAIEEGRTGMFFEQNNRRDLADKIASWLDGRNERDNVRSDCLQVIQKNWNPNRQRELIDAVVSELCDS